MSWKLSEKPKTFRVTKAIAHEYAEMDTLPHERPLSERRLMVYRKILADGGFRPVTWAKCYCKETNTTYRVNGQHTSVMLSSLGSIPEFYVTIESYEAPTLADVGRLYATFDSPQQSRTCRDIYHSFAATIPELREVVPSLIHSIAPAIPYARLQESTSKLTIPERAEMMFDHVDFILWADEIFRPTEGRNATITLRRSPVVSAMLLTWEKSPKDATKFWTLVKDETGASPDDPDRKLARWLATTSMAGGRMTGRKNPNSGVARKCGPREFFVRSLHAWNSWRKGQQVTIRYNPEAAIPEIA